MSKLIVIDWFFKKGTLTDIDFIFSIFSIFLIASLLKFSVISILKFFLIKKISANILHCFNFLTMSFKREYLKLIIGVVLANSNVKKPIKFNFWMTEESFLNKN